MEFGHVHDPDAVDLRLPSDDPITERTLTRLQPPPGPARVYAGLPIWSRKDWVGVLYPEDSPSDNYLPAYSRLFDTVEVNSTYHHPPAPDVIEKWVAAVPARFRFVVKVWKAISHEQAPRPADIAQFLETARAFGDRLGLCFAQLPPRAGLDWRRPLARLIDALAPAVPLAIELRHPDWFRVEPTRSRLLDHLAARGVGLVITDTAGHRDLVHMAVTAAPVLVRFCGENLHPSDLVRTEAWMQRLGLSIDRGLREVYFIAHQSKEREIDGVPVIGRLSAGFIGRDDVEIKPPPRMPERPQLSLL